MPGTKPPSRFTQKLLVVMRTGSRTESAYPPTGLTAANLYSQCLAVPTQKVCWPPQKQGLAAQRKIGGYSYRESGFDYPQGGRATCCSHSRLTVVSLRLRVRRVRPCCLRQLVYAHLPCPTG